MKKFPNNDKWIEDLALYIINKFQDLEKYKIKRSNSISSIFLAWAPWAGKTEFLDTIFLDIKKNFIIIDIDKYRKYFIWYNWENSSEYQNSSVKTADKILKFCFKNDLNFLFDGTFRNYNKVKQNFEQCKKYNRFSLITLIYQEPRISFYYTFLRKINKKRNVPIDVFVDWFYSSINNVFLAVRNFNNVDLIIAHKKYNPFNKDESVFKMDYKTNDIINFCNKYRILYKNWKFINMEKLKFDIEKFNNILILQFSWKWTLIWKFKIWITEKFLKLF